MGLSILQKYAYFLLRLHIRLTPTHTGVNMDIYAYATDTSGIYAYIYAYALVQRSHAATRSPTHIDCVITSEFAYK